MQNSASPAVNAHALGDRGPGDPEKVVVVGGGITGCVLAQRLREFRNPASDEFFEPCETGAHPLPFQCSPDSRLSIEQMRAMQKR